MQEPVPGLVLLPAPEPLLECPNIPVECPNIPVRTSVTPTKTVGCYSCLIDKRLYYRLLIGYFS